MNRQKKSKQYGMTLIEVLIAMFLLVVGILYIIRLFPSGFGVERTAENSGDADRLATTMLSSLSEGVPQGVYAAVPAFNTSTNTLLGTTLFDPTISPDDFSAVGTIAGQSVNFPGANTTTVSDVDKTRYIQNETFTVPAAPAAGESPAHVLNFGPILMTQNIYNTAISPQIDPTTDGDLTLTSTPWKAIQGNSQLDSSNQPIDRPEDTLLPGGAAYMIDYTNGAIAFAPEPYKQKFTFTVTDTSGNLHMSTVEIDPQASATPNAYDGTYWLSSLSNAAFNIPTGPWLPYSDTIVRLAQYYPASAAGPSTTFVGALGDPYAFTMPIAALPDDDFASTNFNVGILQFNNNPLVEAGSGPIVLQASYTVYDWHILHEDHDISWKSNYTSGSSSSSSTSFRLAVNEILESGDSLQQDIFDPGSNTAASVGSVYAGVVPNAVTPVDFIIVNLDNGRYVDMSNNNITDENGKLFTVAQQITVNYHNGTISVPTPFLDGVPVGDTDLPTPIQHLRIYYRTKLNWGVALQRAPEFYSIIPTSVPPTYGMTNPLGPNVTPNLCWYNNNTAQIYFPLCDLAKSMEVRNAVITVTSPSNPADSYTAVVPAATVTPGDSGAGTGTVISTAPLSQWVMVNLDSSSDSPTIQAAIAQATSTWQSMSGNGSLTPTVSVSLSSATVTGTSARAVVVWKENKTWREHDVDTVLAD